MGYVPEILYIMTLLGSGRLKQATGSPCLLKESRYQDTSRKKNDTTSIKGTVSATGLLQSGNENRFVTSLLSELSLGNKNYEVLPLTSIAYSSKPHAQVEGEYLENIIIRYQQSHTFYPAIGLSFEKSFLRKIAYRYSAGITLVANLVNRKSQRIKLGIGVNHEFAKYVPGAFQPAISDEVSYGRSLDQIYIRLKGEDHFFNDNLVFSYDFFYQPNIRNVSDYRWTLIGNLDVPLKRKVSFRVSVVSSYESFVATNVSNENFRLTYGVNLSF